ncbi:MAG: ATP-binding protein [Pseudomonadota bacterium]
MARLTSTFTQRVVLLAVVTQLLLFGALGTAVLRVAEASVEDQFLDHIRRLSRLLADDLESRVASEDPEEIRAQLDSALLNGASAYAEFRGPRGTVLGSFNRPGVHYTGRQDLVFGPQPDRLYFISLPINRLEHNAQLILAFDEGPSLDQLAALQRSLWSKLAIFGALCTLLWIAALRPVLTALRGLQSSARRISRGDHGHPITVDSSVREIAELAVDFEQMRKDLLGVGAQLVEEIARGRDVERMRHALQQRLVAWERLETVGNLAGGIAHEINNLLLPIILHLELARDALPSTDLSQQDLEVALTCARRAREVVRSVLVFSRSAGGGEPVVFELGDSLRESVRLFRAIKPANVELVLAIASARWPVRGDPVQAGQLLMNLLSNAVSAVVTAGRTGGLITVSLEGCRIEPEDAGGGAALPAVQLAVSDTGDGMDAAVMARIFEPFFTTREVGKGTGLGLSVVHGIVAGFHGRISVDSSVGQGTTFTVLLPLAETPLPVGKADAA